MFIPWFLAESLTIFCLTLVGNTALYCALIIRLMVQYQAQVHKPPPSAWNSSLAIPYSGHILFSEFQILHYLTEVLWDVTPCPLVNIYQLAICLPFYTAQHAKWLGYLSGMELYAFFSLLLINMPGHLHVPAALSSERLSPAGCRVVVMRMGQHCQGSKEGRTCSLYIMTSFSCVRFRRFSYALFFVLNSCYISTQSQPQQNLDHFRM